MITYERMKSWGQDNRTSIVCVVAFVVIFFVGVGVGKLPPGPVSKTSSNYSNYSTKKQATAEKPLPAGAEAAEALPAKTAEPAPVPAGNAPSEVLGASTNGPCLIKGTKSKIYHLKGGAFYDRVTKPVVCFKTEDEARAAGYRKSIK